MSKREQGERAYLSRAGVEEAHCGGQGGDQWSGGPSHLSVRGAVLSKKQKREEGSILVTT